MKKVNPKKAAVKKVSVKPTEEQAANFQQLSDAFKADVQKAQEANDMATLAARATQFIADAQALFV